jgi:hypothetical protein
MQPAPRPPSGLPSSPYLASEQSSARATTAPASEQSSARATTTTTNQKQETIATLSPNKRAQLIPIDTSKRATLGPTEFQPNQQQQFPKPSATTTTYDQENTTSAKRGEQHSAQSALRLLLLFEGLMLQMQCKGNGIRAHEDTE